MNKEDLAKVLAAIKDAGAEGMVSEHGYLCPHAIKPHMVSGIISMDRVDSGHYWGGIKSDAARTYILDGLVLTFIDDQLAIASRCVTL